VKGRKPTRRRLAFDDIAKARVEIEFNRKAAERRAQHESAAADDEGKEEA
jgi:ribosome maturation factor RimP